MRKLALTTIVAGAAAFGLAAPAAAQYAPAPGYGYQQPGYGYGNNWLYNFRDNRYSGMMQQRVRALRNDIRQMGAQRILSRGEVRRLDRQAERVERSIWRASRYGVDNREARNLDNQVRRLEENIVRQANDWNRRAGARRYNPYNYGQYYNYYGNNTNWRDRDRDGRNDRYEDDRGRRHD